MDGWLERQQQAIICPLFFVNGYIHTVIKFHQYFQLVIKLWYAQDLYIQNKL